MFKFFRNQEQEKSIKDIGPPQVVKEVSQVLSLASLNIQYSADMKEPYRANITYEQRPTEWRDKGVIDKVEIIGNSWVDLLDRVAEHFNSNRTT